MKALQSDLAKRVLADKHARTQLRMVVSDIQRRRSEAERTDTIVFQDGTTVRRLTATVVPKAA
jgi:hypothetical protein